ncbi:thioredoxin fold domain-containing protein [Azohydromonas australica]|uniref:thioredoxin fold domain-containing protein n=1 Tax=Azohydromonas australica TaxID=364039 RepID=UPI00048ABBFC|nr:thioredoxin fold domain-containing protein [Azohydromonas australica]
MLSSDRRALLRRASCALVAGLLAACSKTESTAAAPSGNDASAAVAEAMALAASARGFSAGPAIAAHTVYVFFDATCPHCARLWADSQMLPDRLKMGWIPVGLLRGGAEHGAVLMAASDPVAAMAANEAAVSSGRTGAPTSAPPADALKLVKANTQVFEKLGVQSVPVIVYRNAATDASGVEVGYLPPNRITALVGL